MNISHSLRQNSMNGLSMICTFYGCVLHHITLTVMAVSSQRRLQESVPPTELWRDQAGKSVPEFALPTRELASEKGGRRSDHTPPWTCRLASPTRPTADKRRAARSLPGGPLCPGVSTA